MTGLTFVPELDFFGKQLEVLRQVVPGISRVAIVWAATNPVHPAIAEATEAAASQLRLPVLNHPVRTLDDIDHVFTALATAGPSASSWSST